MKIILIIGIGYCFLGCSAPLERKTTTPNQLSEKYCIQLDKDHRIWGALAKFSGALAGTGGLATLPIPEDQKTARVSVGISAAVMGAFAAAAVYVEQDAASTWAKQCSE